MKKLLGVLFISAALTTAAHAQNKVDDVAKFSTQLIQMGKLKQGVPASATFVITNISKKPIMIEKAIPSCGCTASDYTKTPIMPGKTGTVTATYNAAAAGTFTKAVTVKIAETPEMTALNIAGEVEAAK